MILKKSVITAAVLAAAAVFTQVVPSTASSGPDLKVWETEMETEEEEASGEKKGDRDLAEILTDSYDLALSVDFEEPIQNAISSGLKNIDMSWLSAASLTGHSKGNQQGGIDASLLLNLNGADLYHGELGIDLDDRKIYVRCPEFQKKAVLIDLSAADEKEETEVLETEADAEALESAKASPEKTTSKKTSKKRSKKKPKANEIAGLSVKLFGELSSISAKEWTDFLGRILPYLAANARISQNENALVTAGGLSDTVLANTVKLDQASVLALLEKVAPSLREDELINKVLTSDGVVELVQLVRRAQGKSYKQLDGEWILDHCQRAMDKAAAGGKSSIPGLSITYAFDAEGRLAELDLDLLYGAFMANAFSFRSVQKEGWNAVEFCPGSLLSSMLVSKTLGDTKQQTGIYAEGKVQDGCLTENVRLLVGGVKVADLMAEDLNLSSLKKGTPTGALSLEMGKAVYRAEFEQIAKDTEVISLKQNDTPYLTLTVSVARNEKAKVDRIDRKGAVTVTDKSSWQSYIADSRLTKMIHSLKDGGVPDSIIESLTSGEAGTEAARENKVEREEGEEDEDIVVAQGAEMGLDSAETLEKP